MLGVSGGWWGWGLFFQLHARKDRGAWHGDEATLIEQLQATVVLYIALACTITVLELTNHMQVLYNIFAVIMHTHTHTHTHAHAHTYNVYIH